MWMFTGIFSYTFVFYIVLLCYNPTPLQITIQNTGFQVEGKNGEQTSKRKQLGFLTKYKSAE